MSGQNYKVAWLCEALLVSRSGYYDWKERRRQPGKRQLENTQLRTPTSVFSKVFHFNMGDTGKPALRAGFYPAMRHDF